MSAQPALAPLARRDLAWRVIGLVNLYRLLLPPVLLAMQWLGGGQDTLLMFSSFNAAA